MFKKTRLLITLFLLFLLNQAVASYSLSNDEIKKQVKTLAMKLYKQACDDVGVDESQRLYQFSMPLLASSMVDKSLYETIDAEMALKIDKVYALPRRAWLLGRMLMAAKDAGSEGRADVYRSKLKRLLGTDLRWSYEMMTGWAWAYYYANTQYGVYENIEGKLDLPYQRVLKAYQENPSDENLSNLLWTISMNVTAASEGYGHISLYTYYVGEYLCQTPYHSFDELMNAMPASDYRGWLISLNVIAALTHHHLDTAAQFESLLNKALESNIISDADRMLALSNLLKIREIERKD